MKALLAAAAIALCGGSLSAAGPALAQDPIPTTPAAAAAPPPAAAPAPLPTSEPLAAEAPQVAMGPCGPEKVKPNGQLETKPHGEVEASVGTGGYRRLAGTVCQPIGQNGAITLSVSQTQFQGGRGR